MNKIRLDNNEYEVIKNVNDGYDLESITNLYTDYFEKYDYIVGDWAYGKLRLKGFCQKNNTLYKKYNDYEGVENYIKTKCAYGCKWFVLKKI